MAQSAEPAQIARNLYLNLIERSLLDSFRASVTTSSVNSGSSISTGQSAGELGGNWSNQEHVKAEQLRVRNLRQMAEQVLEQSVPGDFMSVGMDAGAIVMFKALLDVYGVVDRWVFIGTSSPTQECPVLDASRLVASEPTTAAGDDPHLPILVEALFEKYGLRLEGVVFLKLPIEAKPEYRLCLLAIESGSYEAALEALRLFYDKVSTGGFVSLGGAGDRVAYRKAVEEFRREQGISGPVLDDGGGTVCWRKSVESGVRIQSTAKLEPISNDQPRPFWSVIVPLYERRHYLKQCVDSILDQDPGPDEMEILVVDDASPNDLREFVEQIGRGRVRYVRNPVNLGERANTNRAIGNSCGRWIHILHDDDWVLPGFYATLRKGVETSPESPGVAFCMYAAWHERRNAWWSPLPFRDGAGVMDRSFIVRLAQACPLNLCSVSFSRTAFESVGLFREDLPQTSEWEWYVRSALKLPWHYQPETLACYRVHPDNLTHNRSRLGQNARDFRRAIEAIAQMLPADLAPMIVPVSQEFHSRQLFDSALKFMDANDAELANVFLMEGLAIDPLGPGRPEFAALLQHPGYGALRDEIRSALLAKHGS